MKKEKGMGYYEKHCKYYGKTIKMYFEEGFGYRRISKLIPVAATTIKYWCITFAEANGKKMRSKIYKTHKLAQSTPKLPVIPNDIKSLQAEVARLQKELKDEKLRADAYDIMIDIAESKFNIPIRKKAGAKR